jgi:phospholipase/carboxylesterase
MNRSLPIFIGHGTVDNVVVELLGLQAVKALEDLDYKPDYASYPIAHSICMEEITDISQWLQKQLAKKA